MFKIVLVAEQDKNLQMSPDQLHAMAVSHLEAVAAGGSDFAAEMAKTKLAEVEAGKRFDTQGQFVGAMLISNHHP